MRAGGGPFLLEARTYRFRAHSMADPELYRSKAEVEQWKRRDPITLFVERIRESGLLADPDLAVARGAVAAEVDEAVAFAEAGPWEPVEDLTKDVYTAGGPMTKMTYREALRSALREALRSDPRVFLMGEDVGRYGGSFKRARTGSWRSSARSASATRRSRNRRFVGAGIGAALGGMRPIVEIMTVNFSLLALDQIVNNAATLRHMSGGQLSVPLVVRMATGGGRQLAAQHSHSLEGWYAHIPGIKVVAPATATDARGHAAGGLARS